MPSMIFMFYVSKDTSENPLDQNINFYNLTYFPFDNRIKPDINLISWIDENSLDCNNIHELITVQNKSLDEIFTLNTRYINYLAKSLIAIQFVMLFFIMIFFFANLQQFGIDSVSVNSDGSVGSTIVSILLFCFCGCCIFFAIIIAVLIFLIMLIADIIVFCIMCAQFNNDETNKFLNFLQCDGIDKDIIAKFSDLSYLSVNFNVMKVLHSIFIVIYAILITEIIIIIRKG